MELSELFFLHPAATEPYQPLWENAINSEKVFLKEGTTAYYNAGKVGIGTNTPQSALSVAGEIRGNKLRAMSDISGADFVFEPDYDLPTLPEVEQFIKTHKHLPDIPPAKEMQEQGLDLAQMNIKLLQKVEELMLYTIEQEKRLHAQDQKFKQQQREINRLNLLIENIQKTLKNEL